MSSSSSLESVCVLVVGDGDFSGSLAILRAYRDHIRRLIATSLIPSRDELIRLYPTASSILKELEEDDSTTILFGVNATTLHKDPRLASYDSFDYILFQHPHIGSPSERDTEPHPCNVGTSNMSTNVYNGSSSCPKQPNYAIMAMQHSSLLAHYLYSCRELLLLLFQKTRGRDEDMQRQSVPKIHTCLCAGQSKHWNLKTHLRRLGLEYTERPIVASNPLWSHLIPATTTPSIGTGSSSSSLMNDDDPPSSPFSLQQPEHLHRHRPFGYWLSQYGYQHQATYPSTTQLSPSMNSHHHFFQINNKILQQHNHPHPQPPPLNKEEDDDRTAVSTTTIRSQSTSFLCPICCQKDCVYFEGSL